MAASKRLIGKNAEESASAFLQSKGLKLLEENFNCRMGEIDLIMQDNQHVVFVEVRMRKPNHYGSAFESITRSKQLKIIRTATLYLQQKKWYDKVPCRFDAIAVTPTLSEPTIEWIRNAFSD